MKKALVGVLAATLLMTGACSSSDDNDSSTGTSTKPGEKVELTYWTWAPNMDKVVEEWNAAHPDIHVTVNKQDGGDPAVTKLLTAIKAGSGAPVQHDTCGADDDAAHRDQGRQRRP